MLIKVTKNHIDNGVRGSCSKCPVALALIEQIPNCTKAYVTYLLSISIRQPESMLLKELSSELPENVIRFIANFDINNHVEPFEFECNWK